MNHSGLGAGPCRGKSRGRNPSAALTTRRRLLATGVAGSVSFAATGRFTVTSEARAEATITTSSAAWRHGASVRHQLGRHAISAAAVAWRSDSKRVAWRCSNGPGFIFDVRAEQYGPELPAPQTAATDTGLLWLKGTNTLLLGGAPFGTEPYSPVAFMVVDGDSGKITRLVDGVIPPHQRTDPNAVVQLYPLSQLANCAGRIFQRSMNGPVIVAPFAGLRGFEVFDPATWSVHLEKLIDSVSSPLDLRPGTTEAAFLSTKDLIYVGDRATGHTLCRFQAVPFSASASVVKYSPDGRILLTAMRGILMQPTYDMPDPNEAIRHTIRAWRADDCGPLGQIDTTMNGCDAIDFHPDGQIFAAASGHEVVLFDTRSLGLVARFRVPIQLTLALAFSPDGSWLAVGGSSGVVCLMQP